MLAVRTPGAPLTARVVAACGSAFPSERQGRLLRSRSISGLFSRSLYSGLQPPCLRFATAVTGRHARLGSQLLARLCRGRHLRRQSSTRLQGATRTDPYGPNSGIRLVWGFLCQGGVTPIWSSFAFHSFVRPALRALFRPDRIFPSPSRRSGGQGRRFFQRRRRLVLGGREPGGRLPAIGWLAVR